MLVLFGDRPSSPKIILWFSYIYWLFSHVIVSVSSDPNVVLPGSTVAASPWLEVHSAHHNIWANRRYRSKGLRQDYGDSWYSHLLPTFPDLLIGMCWRCIMGMTQSPNDLWFLDKLDSIFLRKILPQQRRHRRSWMHRHHAAVLSAPVTVDSRVNDIFIFDIFWLFLSLICDLGIIHWHVSHSPIFPRIWRWKICRGLQGNTPSATCWGFMFWYDLISLFEGGTGGAVQNSLRIAQARAGWQAQRSRLDHWCQRRRPWKALNN